MRLIDADAMLKKIKERAHMHPNAYFLTKYAEALVAAEPTVDAVPVVHGHWEKSDIPHEKFCCSVCGGACWYYDYEGDVARSRFCPNCGAKMTGDENEQKK